ncbi:protein FORGETTER 1-like isoform X2 [Nicotiana tabacum]|uniref:Protein FORGETTER 1-like isoform X2 n=1 Tax=Nicotiana tabacum TaxID=4097 RepID=A0AC58SDL7_TOBAC
MWIDLEQFLDFSCMHGPNCKLGSFCTVGRRLQEVNVLGGLILPVWGTVERVLSKQARQSHQRIRIVRIVTTTDNQRIVGLLIPDAAVEPVLQDSFVRAHVGAIKVETRKSDLFKVRQKHTLGP